eukprot:3032814-Rhodomonas_salina.2
MSPACPWECHAAAASLICSLYLVHYLRGFPLCLPPVSNSVTRLTRSRLNQSGPGPPALVSDLKCLKPM